ncbi:hypothetical protein [Microbacterium panaciterrae]|uniref:PqqD family protein n=1 Tax=Microbacterium panaciterrae TaxID=985759 RepID=A0ABP8PGS6_9MICO
MSRYAISPDVAWFEPAQYDGPDHLVWAARLDTAAQFEFTDTAWLVWMLLSDGVASVPGLLAELARIHAELGAQATGATFDAASLTAFLDDLEQSGLVVRTHDC